MLSQAGHSGDGWSLLMVSVNFCVGLRVLTFLLSSSRRQRSHCQAKLNFLTKEEAVVSDEPDPGRGWLVGAGLAPPGNPWQRKLTILLYTSLTLTEKSGHGWAWALLLCQSLKRKCLKFSQCVNLYFTFFKKLNFQFFTANGSLDSMNWIKMLRSLQRSLKFVITIMYALLASKGLNSSNSFAE